MSSDCLRVQIIRGNGVESEHQVDAVVVNSSGDVLRCWGNAERVIYPRSSIKSIQAIALVESGAIEKFNLNEKHLAVACASHNGESKHTGLVHDWLIRMGLSECHLRCGSHAPYDEQTFKELIEKKISINQLHNNCSGKHAGILAATLLMQEDINTYLQKDHPIQKKIKTIFEEMSAYAIPENDWAIDGCGIPTYLSPLKSVAIAMARMGTPKNLSYEKAQACEKITSSIVKEPYYVAGRNRFCTDTMLAARQNLVVKVGAEGVFAGSYLNSDIGIALKARDGAERAAEAAMAFVLLQNNNNENCLTSYLEGLLHTSLKNWAATSVGSIRVVER
ncbi:MAG: asparaginase [Pseudobdellovibrionaceae bacterium]